MRLRWLAAAALPLLFAALSCGGCYYARIGIGQARVLLGRESIEDALASPDLTAAEKEKLALVPDVRAFARREIGLVENGSYTTFYDTGKDPISWNVEACAKTSFRAHLWKFPFVGAAPYKGFFSREQAEEEAARLEAEGWDVVVREVGAYSTLGWFDDPVFRRMLARDVHDLANTIIHELTHATVFREGDATFNESVAQFVGDEGALAFLRARFGPDSPEVRRLADERADDRVFAEFIDALFAKLERVYASDLPEARKLARREEIFAAARGEFEVVRTTRMRLPGAYAGFAKRKLDNAVLMGFRHYHTDVEDFASVLRLNGGDFRATLAVFREAAHSGAPRRHLAAWTAHAGSAKLPASAARPALPKGLKAAEADRGESDGEEQGEVGGAEARKG